MPEFNVAYVVTSLLRRVNFVGRLQRAGMRELRHSAQAMA